MIFLLVDDEFPARQELKFILLDLVPEATIYEASDGVEAVSMLSVVNADAVFLDINMGQRDGLATSALIMEQPNPPFIIFATAYDSYALRAFELAALDYIVKPFTKRRLNQCVTKVRQQVGQQKKLVHQREIIQNLLQNSSQESAVTKLWVEQGNGDRQLLSYDDIAYIEAREKQTFVNTIDGQEWPTRYTLKDLEQRLEDHQFVRTHRAYVVNIQAVFKLIMWFAGGYRLELKDAPKSTIPVSRRFVSTIKQKIV